MELTPARYTLGVQISLDGVVPCKKKHELGKASISLEKIADIT